VGTVLVGRERVSYEGGNTVQRQMHIHIVQELKNTQCHNATRIEKCPDHTTLSHKIYLI